MFCPKCGAANDDSSRFCASCGQDLNAYRQQSAGQPPLQQPPMQTQNPYQQPPYQQPPDQQPYQGGPYGGYPGGMMPKVASHMAWAIISFILFFWPTAIAAIVYASRVGNRLAVGDVYGAQEASRKAKVWCWVSFIIALVLWIFVGVMYAVAWRTTGGVVY
jgi:hypothetical protein